MTQAGTDECGSKRITPTNWQEIDEPTKVWCQLTACAKTNEEWVNFFLEPTLTSDVPANIKTLLESARAAMIYSWYYYPLATLGMGQCFRLLDTGTRLRCEQAGIPTKVRKKNRKDRDMTFEKNVEALMVPGIIREADGGRWTTMRELRNRFSHPTYPDLHDPGEAQNILHLVVEFLNELFLRR